MNNHSLIAQMQHGTMRNGEFVFRMEDEWVAGQISSFEARIDAQTHQWRVTIEGWVPETKR